MSPRTHQRLERLRELCILAHGRAKILALVDGEWRTNTLLQLHATIIELTVGVFSLLAARIYSPAPILVRSAYEAMADQLALSRDPKYLVRMQAQTISEGSKFPEHLSHGEPPRVKEFVARPGAREFLRRMHELGDALAEEGGVRIEAKEKFSAAGIPSEYLFFRFLSAFVHNDMGALGFRHEPEGAASVSPIALFAVPDAAHLHTWIDMAFANLVRSCKLTYKDPSAFQEAGDQYVAIVRADAEAHPNEHRFTLLDEYVRRPPTE